VVNARVGKWQTCRAVPKLWLSQGILTEGKISTLDLLIKVPCFCKNGKKHFQYKKELILTNEYKEINCTEDSPSVRLPWLSS
jgi:hypothetical protein